ncbi:MAG TPA: heavy-metal-associated domain-containing protein [Chitinophagaceae bacterium]|nr:heavy-metal-associated domain-containing protein [Chitinophagaceae bacterium]
MMTKTYKISGMGCDHCVEKVGKALKSLPQISDAQVSLKKGEATLTLNGPVEDSLIRHALNQAGHYDLAEAMVHNSTSI